MEYEKNENNTVENLSPEQNSTIENTPQEKIQLQKNPWWCTLLGITSFIGGVFVIFQAILMVLLMWGLGGMESLWTAWLPLTIMATLSTMMFIQGIGFMKTKRWLPNLLIIMFIISILQKILMSPIISLELIFDGKTIVSHITGIIIIGFVYSKRDLFEN